MKRKTFMILSVIFGMMLFSPPFHPTSFASEKMVDFILKAYPGGPATFIPDDFLKSGSDDDHGYAHEGYLDGFKIICRTKSGKIKSIHAQKQFNTGDLSAEHTYFNILGGVLNKLLKRYNGKVTNEKGRGESTDKVPYDDGDYCYYTALKGEGKTIHSKDFKLGFWYDLGIRKHCDNVGYNSSNPGKVIIEFRPSN